MDKAIYFEHGKKIRNLRRELDLSIAQLASLAGVPESFILALESRKVVPLRSTIELIKLYACFTTLVNSAINSSSSTSTARPHKITVSLEDGNVLLRNFLLINDPGVRTKILEIVRLIGSQNISFRKAVDVVSNTNSIPGKE